MRALLLTLAMCLSGLPANAKYSGGTGEPNDPYQIATAADLIAMGETPKDYDKHFIMTADIDLDPNLPGRKLFDRAVIAPNWEPPFTGVFEGDGHTISHLTIKGDTPAGLFGSLAFGAEVKDLGVVDVSIDSRFAGGLASTNGGSVTRCYSTGTVRSTTSVGGLLGHNSGTATQCYSAVAVSGAGCVGGLVGENYGGAVTHCYSTGTVSGAGQYMCVGGLVGENYMESSVTQCYSTGGVSGTSTSAVGGLVGSGVLATDSFWDIQTSGQTTSVGGVGKATAEMQTASTFLEAGWDFTGETANGMDDIWKIAEGLGYPRLSWEKYSGGTGEPNDPYQIATAADLIALGETPEDYDKHFVLTADIDLDPNLPGRKVFDRAVIAPDTDDATWQFEGTSFTGLFDGNGHRVSHVMIKGVGYLGLFGDLAAGAEVRDLGIVHVNIIGSSDYVGGLVGCNIGTATRCYSTGTVSGNECAGGLVGINGGRGSFLARISDCYSTSAASGDVSVGGLVGGNDGVVANSYSAGMVKADWSVGGLVGENFGTVSQCHSSGAVIGGTSWDVGGLVGSDSGEVANCFWDTQTSGQTTSAGGTGKTTAEMQTASTFLEAGWDFVGETVNGTEDIWWILEGKGYPHLWGQAGDGASP